MRRLDLSITITITEETPAQILAALVDLAAAASASSAPAAASDKPAAKTATKVPAKPKDPEPAAEPETAEIDFERDVASRIQKLTAAKGRGVTLEVLSEFGVERASHLDAARLPELIEKIDEELAR